MRVILMTAIAMLLIQYPVFSIMIENPQTGDVVAPMSNNDSYVPQWNGANSKTLQNGFPITTQGKALIAKTSTSDMVAYLNASSNISGTSNYIAKFTGTSTAGNSIIYQNASGNIGIGTIYPQRVFSVSGNVQITGNQTVAYGLNVGSSTGAGTGEIKASSGGSFMGSVGIKTTSPQRDLSVVGDLQVTGNIYETNATYGGMYVSGNTTATAVNGTNWTTVTVNVVSGTLKNSTFSTGILTVKKSGTYWVMACGNYTKTAADDIYFGISKNNAIPEGKTVHDEDEITTHGKIVCQGLFALAENDTLRLKTRNATAARNVTVEYMNFIVFRMSVN